MNGCLKDQTLLFLYEGEGTASQRVHLAGCDACTARYSRLARDVEGIGRVLRGNPPRITTGYALAFCWAKSGAALALTIALVWVSLWLWYLSPAPHLKETRNGEIWNLMVEMSGDLLSADEAIAAAAWFPGIDGYDVPMAGEEEPCAVVDESITGEEELNHRIAAAEDGLGMLALLCEW